MRRIISRAFSSSSPPPPSAAPPFPAIRYALRALTNHQSFDSDLARELLSNVAHRLSVQTSVCDDLLLFLLRQERPGQEKKNVRHLRYLHHDTHRLCRQVSDNFNLFGRWSDADRHVVLATLRQVRDRHAASLERWVDVATANYGRDDGGRDGDVVLEILRRRLGIQLLCQHGILLGNGTPRGVASVDCPIRGCVEEAYTEAGHVCEAHLQTKPELQFVNKDGDAAKATVVRFWLHHALVELLKNAMKSSVEQSILVGQQHASPIRVVIGTAPDGGAVLKEDLVIDIEDDGIGLPASSGDEKDRLFRIGHTSAKKRWDRLDEQQSYAAVRSPLSSLGVGLPVSRIMMQHFGGDVELLHRLSGCTARIRIPTDTTILEPKITISASRVGSEDALNSSVSAVG